MNCLILHHTILLATLLTHFSDAVNIDVDTSHARDLEDFGAETKRVLESWYDNFAFYLQSPTFRNVDHIAIYIDPEYNGVAYAKRGRIVGAANYYRSHRDDIGSMIHEMVHVMQNYCPASSPSWLQEGIADYYRYYFFEKIRQPSKPGPADSYTKGYSTTAYFLNYVVQHVRSDMMYWLNKDLREGKYSDSIWSRLTGKSLSALWVDMMEGD